MYSFQVQVLTPRALCSDLHWAKILVYISLAARGRKLASVVGGLDGCHTGKTRLFFFFWVRLRDYAHVTQRSAPAQV